MPKKRSTRNSNNTSINTDNSGVSNSTGSNATVENEDTGKKRKNNPYYSWW
jgi:hypothetical protein